MLNLKYKEATDAEVTRLRAAAKIEYLNAKAPESSAADKPVVPQAAPNADNATNNLNLTEPISNSSIERGIMGLK